MNSGRRPTTLGESQHIAELFDVWCWTASDDSDWSSLQDFMSWLGDSSEELEDTLSASFYSHFQSWAESELENAVDMADDEDEATSALQHIRQTVTEYLGAESMHDEFASAEQSKSTKFSGYEPTMEDLEHLRETAAVIEGDAEEEPYTPPSSTRNADESAPSEDDIIRGMFRQLS